MVMSAVSTVMKTRVADPALRREVEAAVRRRVRSDEAEDVVQATLADVLSASTVPEEPEEFRRFVFGVARNKVFDHFRRQKRQTDGLDDNEPAAPEPPLSARDILRWAEGELPDSEAQTLEWMLREGDGEKLEHIARDAKLPATRVRKRVSRLRKFLRDRWAAELMLAGLAALLCGLSVLYWYAKGRTTDDVVEREPVRPVPSAPHAVEPSRPAGSAEPIPNQAVPTPSAAPPSSAAPAPSAVPSATPDRVRTKQTTKPTSTEDGRSFPAPIVTGKVPAPEKLNIMDSEPSQMTKSGRLEPAPQKPSPPKKAAKAASDVDEVLDLPMDSKSRGKK
jgi:RNA polymerase sigma factor (sigma-70 family)